MTNPEETILGAYRDLVTRTFSTALFTTLTNGREPTFPPIGNWLDKQKHRGIPCIPEIDPSIYLSVHLSFYSESNTNLYWSFSKSIKEDSISQALATLKKSSFRVFIFLHPYGFPDMYLWTTPFPWHSTTSGSCLSSSSPFPSTFIFFLSQDENPCPYSPSSFYTQFCTVKAQEPRWLAQNSFYWYGGKRGNAK